MLRKSRQLPAYVPPRIESEAFRVEEGFADSVTEEWTNSFDVNAPASGTEGKVDLLLWTNQTRTTPTNANEQFDIGWSNNDFWGIP